ncbi:MAG: organomercurial lyase [Jiangellaceae bacterium]
MTALGLDKAAAVASLSPAARRAHQAVLSAFATTGQAPSGRLLRRLVPAGTRAELAEADVLAFDDRGELRAAYPFSPRATAITVTWADGPTVFAMCAIDALGTSAMLGQHVVITASEPGSDEMVIVDVNLGQARWIPDTAVVLACSMQDACCPSVDRTCGYINFFTSTRAARDWASRHPHLRAVVLDQSAALTAGIAEFAGHLEGGP